MVSLDSNFNFLCGRPHGAGAPLPPVHMRPPEPDPLRVDVINGWPLTGEQTSLPSIGPDPRIWNGTSAYSFGLNKLVSAILFSLAGGETSRRLLRLMAYAYENVTADHIYAAD